MFLAIDIGNTSTSVGITASNGQWRTTRRNTGEILAEAVVLKIVNALGIEPQAITQIGIASVVPALDAAFAEAVHDATNCAPIFLTEHNYPHPIRYPHPEEIGADRLADAAGALAKFTPPLIIVDFGTATTFDYIDRDGAYCGGPIMPGVLLAKRALSEAAEKLPPVEFAAMDHLLPRTTVEAMQAGLFHGTVGAVDHVLAQLIAEVGGAPMLLATGGLASTVIPALRHRLQIEPTLTLEGIAITISA